MCGCVLLDVSSLLGRENGTTIWEMREKGRCGKEFRGKKSEDQQELSFVK